MSDEKNILETASEEARERAKALLPRVLEVARGAIEARAAPAPDSEIEGGLDEAIERATALGDKLEAEIERRKEAAALAREALKSAISIAFKVAPLAV